MPEDQNLEVIRSFFENVLNGGDMAALGTYFHSDVSIPQSTPGIDSLRRQLTEMRATFASPDYKVLETVSQGERVVVRFSGRATHAGLFMGIPPSGRTLSVWGVMIFGFEAGAISEYWSLVDAQGILKQLRRA